MQNPADNIETLKAVYAALNRNDVEGFVSAFDPEIVRIEPANFPQEGTYRGLEAVKAHVAKGRGSWAEGACEPTGFIVAGDRIIALIHVHVRLKVETQWREGRVGDVFTFRDGKVTEFRTFFNEAEALEYAGVKPSA